MSTFDIGLQTQAWFRRRGALVENTHQIVFQQRLRFEIDVTAMKVRTEAHHQVEAAFAQCFGWDIGFEFEHIDHHRKVGEVEGFQQARQDQLLEIFRCADVEGHGLQARVERG
ncbi:hypothetical protein D3C85_1614980 [compost metagenome]